jgi:hypothetical protein
VAGQAKHLVLLGTFGGHVGEARKKNFSIKVDY